MEKHPKKQSIFLERKFAKKKMNKKAHRSTKTKNTKTQKNKIPDLDSFFDNLLTAVEAFIQKDASGMTKLLHGLLKFWPKVSPTKEQYYMKEIIELLDSLKQKPDFDDREPSLVEVLWLVFERLIECMKSPHNSVSERAILFWTDDTIISFVDLDSRKSWPVILKALKNNAENYWLSSIRSICDQVCEQFKMRNETLYNEIIQQIEKENSIIDPKTAYQNV